MYGLIIEGVRFMIQENFGPQVLAQILELTQLEDKSISTHDTYSEHIVPNLLRTTCEVTGMTPDQVGVLAGRFFVQFLIRHGYGDLMHVMGRRFSDFLKGLDNLHEYFRFSYPKIRAPSFYCSAETEDGLILHYRSRRQEYISYVIGQLVELARIFYKQELGVKILKKKEKGKFLFVIIQLSFNNTGLGLDNRLKDRVKNLNEYLPVDTISFLKMFPFHVAFNRKLDIIMCGQGLLNLMPEIPGQNMVDLFDLQKPCIKFTAEGCLAHENCNFQLESLHPVVKRNQDAITLKVNDVTEEQVEVEAAEKRDDEYNDQNLPYVVLRGPIVYLKSCEMFILLATCLVDGLDDMFRMGLFLNDYGDADCNREIIMASIQKSDHLKNLLQSEKQRSQVLTEMTREISDNKRKARQLLSQMMPVDVANTMLRTGRSDQCESFECVTIGFVKVVDFARQTDQMTPVDIVNLLNGVYLTFDEMVDIHGVYKVETIGESYMISAGVPYKEDFDTTIMADCCLHMINKMKDSDMKFADGKRVQVKIGMFTGPCVGGIVGARNPRYCLFGDTVNCASRMESHNKVPMTIQIGQRTKDRLDRQSPNKFKVKHRGVINVKGKGDMKAYEVVSKSGRPRYLTHPPKKPEIDQEEHEDGIEELEEDHDRTSALSRMSMNWGESTDNSRVGSSYSRRTSDSSETTNINKSLQQTLAQVSSTALFSASYPTAFAEVTGIRKEEDQLLKTFEKTPKKQSQPKALPKLESHPHMVDTVPAKQPQQIDKTASVLSLASSTIQDRDERLQDDISISLTSATATPMINGEATLSTANTPYPTVEHINGVSETDEVRTMSTDFVAEPADRIPVDLPQRAQSSSAHEDDSTDPDDMWNKDDRLDKKKKIQSKEMRTATKLLGSQQKREPELQEKKILPEIGKRGSEKRKSVKGKETNLRGHSHGIGEECRCQGIRQDPKLKTKVCSVQ